MAFAEQVTKATSKLWQKNVRSGDNIERCSEELRLLLADATDEQVAELAEHHQKQYSSYAAALAETQRRREVARDKTAWDKEQAAVRERIAKYLKAKHGD